MDEIPEREGGDITAADMIDNEESSEIVQFYSGSTIFITGATGYLGKMFLEKLLRECYGLKKIYVMVRPKRGKDVQTRFDEIFDGPNMEPLKRKYPNFREKVILISGDCSLPDLGLSKDDREMLYQEVNVLLHCAATVRFDEKIRIAAHINVRAVIDILKMAKQMKQLKAALHISTAFSNCVHQRIDETFYPPPITAEKVLAIVDALDEDKLSKITPILLGDFPNTYVFTKAIAEDVIKNEGKNLPIVICRPSIVIGSFREPVAGWIDNLYGATGVFLGAAVGLIRSIHAVGSNKAEMVPADYVINCGLAAAYEVALIKSINDNKEIKETNWKEEKYESEVPVYNFVSSSQSPITWSCFMNLLEKHATQVPSPLLIWYYFFAIRSTRMGHLLSSFFYQTIPAYIVDFIAICLRKEPRLVKGYQKINKFLEVVSYFATREWCFSNNNVQNLWQKLNKTDRHLFEFSMHKFNWDEYFYFYVRGARTYLLKDPMSTLKEGKIKYYKLMLSHYLLLAILFVIFCKILLFLYSYLC